MDFGGNNTPAIRGDSQTPAPSSAPVILCDVPKRISVTAAEIAILRSFLASEIDEILHSSRPDAASPPSQGRAFDRTAKSLRSSPTPKLLRKFKPAQ
jgi:hypothetical protein